MREKLTKRKDYGCACWNGDQNLTTHRRYLEMLEVLAKYEDVIFDADGNEVISLARLRKLAEAEREGNIPKLNLGDKVYWLPDTLSFAFGNIAEATISMVSKGVKTLGWKYRIFTLPTPEHGGNKDKYQQDISEYDIGKHYFLTQAEAERALAATEPKGDADV